jgi:DNA-binding response OmpR family regulator
MYRGWPRVGSLSDMRVLVVEDERRLASTIKRALEEQSIAVDLTGDGENAIEACRAVDYDVVLLDLMLPKIDGLEVARRLRAEGRGTPILVVTARDSVEDRVAGLETGADDYLVKPFALPELIARIRALARRHLETRSSIMKDAGVELDTGAGTVRVGTELLRLTAKEYAILEYFFHNRGQLLTRSQILEHVWSHEFDGEGDNLVEVYVGRVRRKLTAAGADDMFDTVRGAGYRFGSPVR